ncbi:MAG: primosomal protein N', partial [Lachnospiraceae bacterium]|nr:primosomal protein N' [Lachnospiraceae bacterium]
YGITGSGKTEVYIELIKHVIKDNKKVIVLIPEISLTYQTVIRLKQVFEEEISIIHSRMSEGEKYLSYKKCLDGKASILVGPRSAIFAPFDDLGLIVIDEVHDHSYKQDVSPRYDTLDIARYRMKRQECMLLTLSATPSVSHYYRALHNDDITIHRLTKRASKNVSLPSISLVDMREEFHSKNKSSFSKALKELIKERLDNKEQVMLFMNKRGLSRFEKCLDCGETIKCPHCDVSLVVHNDGKAKCHYCGYEENIATTCPKCHSDHIISFGMGTERLEEKCKEEFPTARILRMDRDTTIKKGGMDNIIKDFRNNKADILIGTQMIVKGHDFPNVTLVGIMCADMSLYMPTYKATE